MIDNTEESYLRGHKIYYDKVLKEWMYYDTHKLTAETYTTRPCGNCNKQPTKEGPDFCLGTLPGIMNACCGHGKEDPYIQFLDGFSISGEDAKIIIEILKKITK